MIPRDWKRPDTKLAPFAKVSKHYGPGPHPSGSPQSVHGGGKGKQPWRSTLTRTEIQWHEPSLPDRARERVYSFTPERRAAHERAVRKFEEAFPGALPPKIEIIVSPQDHGAAWVNPFTVEESHQIHIGMFGDLADREHVKKFIIKKLNEMDDEQLGRYRLMASWDYVMQEFADGDWFERYEEAVIFHELAHVAVAVRGWGTDMPSSYPEHPYEDSTMFMLGIALSEKLAPSLYSTVSPPEFFAEALTDVHYNGDDAAPVSHEIADWFMSEYVNA